MNPVETKLVTSMNLSARIKPLPCRAVGALRSLNVVIPSFQSTGLAVLLSRFRMVIGSLGPLLLRYKATTPLMYGAAIENARENSETALGKR